MINRTSVFVVLDDAIQRERCRQQLANLSVVIKCVGTGEKLLSALEEETPGCAIVDIDLPDMNALEILRTLNNRSIRCPVILLASHTDVWSAIAAMKEGAHDVLERNCTDHRLVVAVSEALSITQQLIEDAARREVISRRLASLTDQEKTVLAFFLRGYPNKSIASRLGMSMRTLGFRRTSILRKMNARTLIETAQQVAMISKIGEVEPLADVKAAAVRPMPEFSPPV